MMSCPSASGLCVCASLCRFLKVFFCLDACKCLELHMPLKCLFVLFCWMFAVFVFSSYVLSCSAFVCTFMYIRNVFHASCSQLALPRCEFDFLLYVRYVVLMLSLHSIFRDVWALIYILYLNAYAVHLNPGQMGGGFSAFPPPSAPARPTPPPSWPFSLWLHSLVY